MYQPYRSLNAPLFLVLIQRETTDNFPLVIDFEHLRAVCTIGMPFDYE